MKWTFNSVSLWQGAINQRAQAPVSHSNHQSFVVSAARCCIPRSIHPSSLSHSFFHSLPTLALLLFLSFALLILFVGFVPLSLSFSPLPLFLRFVSPFLPISAECGILKVVNKTTHTITPNNKVLTSTFPTCQMSTRPDTLMDAPQC